MALISSCERTLSKFYAYEEEILCEAERVSRGNFVLANYVTFLLSVQIPPMRDRLFWCVAKAQIVIILILFEGGLLCVEK